MPASDRPRPKGRPVGCPSNLTLDEISAGELAGGPENDPVLSHVEHCADCRGRLLARQADPILAPDPIRFRPLLLAEAGQAKKPIRKPPARRRRPWIAITGLCAGAAVAGLVVWNHGAGRPEEEAGDLTKGALALTIHIKRAPSPGLPETIEAVNGEGRLRAGEEMRFSVAMARGGYAVVLGLDALPSVTTYVPAAGASERPVRVEPPGPMTLPGSVIADGTAGFERIVAIVCQAPTSPETLRRQAAAALAKAGGRPEGVSSLGTGCVETSVLLRKDPR
jgi:hypothetical protein